jgi:hypothetical protein
MNQSNTKATTSEEKKQLWGLWVLSLDDWMMDGARKAKWNSEKEADSWRRNHTVHPDHYVVKKI